MENRLLVIQTAFPGDAILTLPMIQKLKEYNPDSSIDIVCITSTSEIFLASPSVANVHIFDKRKKHRSILKMISFAKELKKNNYSAVYSPHRSLRTSLLVMFLNIEESFGFSNSSIKYVYKNITEYIPGHHEVERNLSLAGVSTTNDSWKILPVLKATDENIKNVEDFFSSVKKEEKTAIIAPGAVWNTKKYPFEYYIEIIKYLINKKFTVLLNGGEKDKKLCEQLASSCKENVISIAGKFSLVESFEVMKRGDIVISNDSAPTHLAVAADVPVLTIYCSTTPGFGFYPYHSKGKYIAADDLYCHPCGIHGFQECPLNHFKCGMDLKPEKIIVKIKELLNENNKE